jgi:hypothetical protein
MGFDLIFQAIPENCDLLANARRNQEIAEELTFFHTYATGTHRPGWTPETPLEIYMDTAIKSLIQTHPQLIDHYLYASKRAYDMIVYLLSAVRRAERAGRFVDTSPINQAIYGSEKLHPLASATQGRAIGFVPAKQVRALANFLSATTSSNLREHFNPTDAAQMEIYNRIYKWGEATTDQEFHHIWQEFTAIRDFYKTATAANEAVIICND